jgi:hypothetical protein
MRMSLTESLDKILQIIEGSCTDAGGDIHIDPANLTVFSKETTYLKERLSIEPFQSVLLAVIIHCDSISKRSFTHIGKALGMTYLRFLSFSKDLYALQNRGLIQVEAKSGIRVPPEVIEFLMRDEVYPMPQKEGMSTKRIFRKIGFFVKHMAEKELPVSFALEEIDGLCSANPDTSIGKSYVQYLKNGNLDGMERLMFYTLIHLYLHCSLKIYDMDDIAEYVPDHSWITELKNRYAGGKLRLETIGLIRPSEIGREYFTFTDDVIEQLFSETTERKEEVDTIEPIDCIDCGEKPIKEMFYNPEEEQQLERLEKLLEEEALKKVFENMSSKGLRTGFTCLFYGEPGTGKTETVYQIARKTGRKIIETDVAQLRDCFIGETEKNVRELFRDYRLACSTEERCPILLFNEADAILGTRMGNAVRAVDRMENSVQNILLQEMENFSGILIATTNLQNNLDPAFERRFLYKVRFTKPNLESRARIWKSQFPALTEEESLTIARAFKFSGGQIENIVRKNIIDNILFGTNSGLERLFQLCREESLVKNPGSRIGFKLSCAS